LEKNDNLEIVIVFFQRDKMMFEKKMINQTVWKKRQNEQFFGTVWNRLEPFGEKMTICVLKKK